MFCQNCGAKNNDEDIFCGACGARLEKEEVLAAPVENMEYSNQENIQPQKNVVGEVAPKRPIPKICWLMALEVIAIFACIYFVKNAAEEQFSAKRTAETYFVHMVNGDFSHAYDMLTVPKSDFLSKEAYIQAMQQKTFGDVSDYMAVEGKSSFEDMLDVSASDEEGLGKYIRIKYRTVGQDSDSYYEVNVSKTKDKQYLLFDDWKVADSTLWLQDVRIVVPDGAVVTVDGMQVGEQFLADKDNELAYYAIPYLFCGRHEIEVSMDGYETVKGIFDAYDGYEVYHMNYTEKTIKELQNLAIENMKKIYSAAVEKEKFSEIEGLFSKDSDCLDNIQSDYEYLLDSLNSDLYINTKITALDASSSTNDSFVNVSVRGTINYYYVDWWSGEKSKEQRDLDSQMYFRFVKENGKWVQTSLGCERFYY